MLSWYFQLHLPRCIMPYFLYWVRETAIDGARLNVLLAPFVLKIVMQFDFL